MRNKKIIILVFLVLISQYSYGNQMEELLEEGIGTRANCMGGAYTGYAMDVSSGFYNPATLGASGLTGVDGGYVFSSDNSSKLQLNAVYSIKRERGISTVTMKTVIVYITNKEVTLITNRMENSTNFKVSTNYKSSILTNKKIINKSKESIGNNFGISIGMSLLSVDDLVVIDSSGQEGETIEYGNGFFYGAGGYEVMRDISIGVSGVLVNNRIGEYKNSALLINTGIFYDRFKNFKIGITLNNISLSESYQLISQTINKKVVIGLSYRGDFNKNSLSVVLNSSYNLKTKDFMINSGMELGLFRDILLIRVGYVSDITYVNNLNFGLGFNLGVGGYKVQCNYLFSPGGDMGSKNQIGLTFMN